MTLRTCLGFNQKFVIGDGGGGGGIDVIPLLSTYHT